MISSSRPPTTTGILVVQAHPILASTIVEILQDDPDLSVFPVARTGTEAVLIATCETVGVVLIDYQLPDMTGAAAARIIKAARPETAIVFHTVVDSEAAMLDAVDAGACAYLTRHATAEQIVETVRRASRGEVLIPVDLFARAIARRRTASTRTRDRDKLLADFTARELDILHLLAEGHDTLAMSQRLGIAPHTVEWHVRHVIEKLDVHSKLQAVIAAARLGIIDLNSSSLFMALGADSTLPTARTAVSA